MNWKYLNPKFEYEESFNDMSWPWVGHRYFAYDLIRIIKPKRVVELGTHKGTSLFSFCQAVKDEKIDTELCAVDTWQGDEHAGFYGDEIYGEVNDVIEKYYNSLNVRLIRKTFDEALSDFEDKSIDILHIDGLHTYEAVKHDFETWFPKLKDDGIVLFHDIVVTRDDFGVFRFWKELKDNFETMEFRHSYGLGVLFNNKENKVINLRNDLELHYSYLLEDIENGKIGELQQNLVIKNMEIKEKNTEIEEKNEEIKEKNTEIEEKNEEIKEKNTEIEEKNEEIEEKNTEIEEKNEEIKEKNTEIEEKNEEIEEKNTEIELIKSSSFWKMRNFYLKIKHYFIFIFLNPRKFLKKFLKLFPLLCVEVLNSMKKENPKKTATRIFNYVIYGKEVLNKDEIGKRRIGFIPSPKSMREIESLEIKNIESIHFQKFEEVRVSIVIPVYNKWQYTYICLSSLKKNINRRIPYEVILIDDGSTDETQNLSENIVSNIVYVKNDKNLGFVGSCNVGAKKARGKFIVFLNNDTFIKKYWLESLIDTFENNENVGLVGSKLICADGVLQEAGGIVWKNKNCWNYGRFGNPTDPAFNYLKDVDYCSGASIMLSREIFDKLSGFDEVYAPGYFEDTDLAFRVRQLGLRTVYQPKSELYHFENISAGKDETSGMRQYIVLNRETFFDRWKGVLSEENCDENIEGSFLARDRSKNKKTVLVIDHYVPTFDQDAGSRSTFQYIKLLCQMGYNVKFFGDNCVKTEPYTGVLQQMGVEVLYGEWFLDNFNSWLNDNGKYIDFVFVNRPHIFEKHIDNIKKYTNAKVVFYGHDLHFLRLKREYDVTKDEKFLEESNIWREKELDIIKKADVSLYPSVVEVDILNKIDALKDSCIDVLNLNIYNDTSFGYKSEDRRDILFIGGFSHRPNVDAILWFCKDIFPSFIKKYPDVIFYIIGSNPPKEVTDLSSKNIIVKGFVSDEELGALYRKIRLVVVPLRYGAGIKGKIIEALYYCVPVLTTNCGAEGIDDNVLMIANDAENFSQSLVNNYENYRFLNDLSKNGKIFVNKQYSINLAKEKIIKYFV